MRGKIIGKTSFISERPVWLLILILFLGNLMSVISACSPEISVSAPALEPEKSSPTDGAEKMPEETLILEDNENGRSLFISKACTGCHTIKGMPEAQGKVGPELTHQAGNSLIGDVLPNTDENMKEWLKDPSTVKPGTIMPNQNLKDSEINALVAFLRTLK